MGVSSGAFDRLKDIFLKQVCGEVLKPQGTDSGDIPITYIDEGCVHIIRVLFTAFDWNDYSVKFICKEDSEWLAAYQRSLPDQSHKVVGHRYQSFFGFYAFYFLKPL